MLWKLRKLLGRETELQRVVPPSKPDQPPVRVTVTEEHMPQAVQELREHMRRDFDARFGWATLSKDWLVASAVDPRTKVLSAYGLSRDQVGMIGRCLFMMDH